MIDSITQKFQSSWREPSCALLASALDHASWPVPNQPSILDASKIPMTPVPFRLVRTSYTLNSEPHMFQHWASRS